LIALGTGAPNASCYPFEKITVATKDHQEFTIDGKLLNVALNYAPTPGLPDVVKWLKEFQIKIHNPPTAKRSDDDDAKLDLIVVPGSQDGLSKSLEMLLQPGDSVLVEEPTYPGTIAILKPYALQFLTIESDGQGIKPESLRKLLTPWATPTSRRPEMKMPKVIIVQPNHCNPTGVSLPLERRLEIYKIAQEYDLLIIEDDPYYFLTFDGIRPPPSFLSMDTDGRVLKLDSLSKVMSAGIRMGMLTGPKALVSRVMMHLSTSGIQCNTLSQVIVLQLFQKWGHDGFVEHALGVAKFYESQCKKMLRAAEDHLAGLAEWFVPTGGMFLWIKAKGVKDTYKMITERALSKKVVLAPGNLFMIDSSKPTSYMRSSFSAVTEEQMQEAFKRLADLIREETAQHAG